MAQEKPYTARPVRPEAAVTVEVYSYGAESSRQADRALDTHPEIFESDDIPPQPARQLHARTCPDCGAVYHVAVGPCPAVGCPSSLEEEEEVEELPTRSKKDVDPQDEFTERAELHEGLLVGLLNSYASDGLTELNRDQAAVFRRLLTRVGIPALSRTVTAQSTTYSADFEEEDGDAHVHLTLRADGTGCVRAIRPHHHTDLGVEWNQDGDFDDVVTPFAEIRGEWSRREGARLIEQAHAIRGGR